MSTALESPYSVEDVHAIHMKAAKMFIVNLRDDDNAKEYIESRGLNFAWALDNGIGYSLPKWGQLADSLSKPEREIAKACGLIAYSEKSNRHYDVFRDRIMFPILNNDGLMVGMGGRDISGESDAKYINTRETNSFKKHEVLYNLHRCSSLNQTDIVVVEGYMDVIAARHAGIDNMTAVMGTAFSEQHARACISKGVRSVTFCYDGDNAGVVAARKSLVSAGILREHGIDVSYVFLPDGADPDDIISKRGADYFGALIESGVTPEQFVSEFAIRTITPGDSIDLSLKATSQALIDCDDAGLNTSKAWDHIHSLLSESQRKVCHQYAISVFPGISTREQGSNSTPELEREQKNFSPK